MDADLAATTGIHTVEDILKALLVGADVTMLASVLLREGPARLTTLEEGLRDWLDEHEYDSVEQLKGRVRESMDAAERWRTLLEAWAVPQPILDAAPVSPHGFDVAPFAGAADEAVGAPTPSHDAARAALPEGGSVLDVGCGAGAASMPLAPPAARLIGVDEHPGMLDAFAERAAARGAEHAEVLGRWPDVAEDAPTADVVVCHHVLYNVADLPPFVAALDGHARRRVVVELTATHPLAWMNPLWEQLHGIERPQGPTAADAVAVLGGLGASPSIVRWEGPFRLARSEAVDVLAFARRRLCLDASHDPELRAALDAHPPPPTRQLVTLAWSPAGIR